MGANEISNNFRAAVQYDGVADSIVAQSGQIASVVRAGVGAYVVALAAPAAIAELSMDTALYGIVPGVVVVRPVDVGQSSEFDVLTFDLAGVAVDRQWSLNLFQLPIAV